MVVRRLKSNALPLAVFLCSFAYLYVARKYGFNEADEGIPLNGGMRILKGDLPWKDFQGYAPGRYFLYALIFKLFGTDILTARAGMALLSALVAMTIVVSARKIMPVPFALLAGLSFVAVPGVYYDRYIQLFSALSIYLFSKYCEGWRAAPFYLGMTGAVALAFRFDIGAIVFFSCLLAVGFKEFWHERDGRRCAATVGLGVLGALVLLVPALGIFYSWGILGDLVLFHGNYFFGGYQTLALKFPMWPAFSRYELAMFYLPVGIYLAGGVVLARERQKQPVGPCYFLKVFIWVIGVCSFHQAVWRTQPENIVKAMVPVWIVYGLLGSLLCEKIRGMPRRLALPGWLPATFTAAAAVLVLAAPLTYAYTTAKKYPFHLSSAGWHPEIYKPMDLDRARVSPLYYLSDIFSEMVSYIRKTVPPGGSIYTPWMGLGILFLADRGNPSFFEFVLPPEIPTYPGIEGKIAADLDREQTPLVVFYNEALDGREERRFKNYARNLYEYLMSHYYLDRTFGNYWALRRGKNNVAALQIVNGSVTEELRGEVKLGQTFRAQTGNLNEIRVRIYTQNRDIGGAVKFHLLENPESGRELATLDVPLTRTVVNEWYSFKFPPLADSAGKNFYFYLEAPSAAPGNAIALWMHPRDAYPDGDFYRGNRRESGDLAFIALAAREPGEGDDADPTARGLKQTGR